MLTDYVGGVEVNKFVLQIGSEEASLGVVGG
jgi:hypothetical protein